MILDDRFCLTHRRVTHEVCRDGDGPAVLLLHELPSLTPACLKLASRIVRYGYRVYVPLFFGLPTHAPQAQPHTTQPSYRIRHEFHLLSTQGTSPLVEWLREVSRIADRQAGRKGGSVVAMCLTESTVLSRMLDVHHGLPSLHRTSETTPQPGSLRT